MSDFSQNRLSPVATGQDAADGGHGDRLAQAPVYDDTLAQLSEFSESEQTVLHEAHVALGNVAAQALHEGRLPEDVAQHLTDVAHDVSNLSKLAGCVEPDRRDPFNDEPRTNFGKAAARIIGIVDANMGRAVSESAAYPSSTQVATDKVVASLLEILSNNFGLAALSAEIGELIDYRSMHVDGLTAAGVRDKIDTVATVTQIGFMTHSGEILRPIGVCLFTDPLRYATAHFQGR